MKLHPTPRQILRICLLALSLLISGGAYAQQSSFEQETQRLTLLGLDSLLRAGGLSEGDVLIPDVTAAHISRNSGIHHIYIQQRYQGLIVKKAVGSVHAMRGRIFSLTNRFVKDIATKVVTTTPAISAAQAVENAAFYLEYGKIPLPTVVTAPATGDPEQNTLLDKGTISREDIPAKLVFANHNGMCYIAWNLVIEEPSGKNWWEVQVDANTGALIGKDNWTKSCSFDQSVAGRDEPAHDHSQCYHHDLADFYQPDGVTGEAKVNAPDSYRVYAMPVESPSHGSRSLVANPANATASPFGWHDTDGAAGAEFTITRGNNVYAQLDDDADNSTFGFSPDGGAGLDFDFPIDLTLAPSTYSSASLVNLFYWNNILHDVMYQYGFDEPAGNFQQNNYGKGGAGGDYVIADGQDASDLNNARFGTPVDGSRPRMSMYLWDETTPGRDGSLDGLVIGHEYGHGISTRLTGGPAVNNCLDNDEQMGEGWSDFYGLMLTMRNTDTGPMGRGVGTYPLGEATNGPGIRARRYSTDLAVDDRTYDDIKSTGGPHPLGSVWCTMLWEVNWALIDVYGFSSNFYDANGGAGNQRALRLVTEALKLQPCSPGFVDGRDAILAADQALYGGAHSCLIWRAFAKRGLGFSADQGSTDNRNDGTEAFDLPPGVAVVASCQNASVNLDPSGAIIVNASIFDNGSSGGCGNLSFTFTASGVGTLLRGCANVGTSTIGITVTDEFLGTSSCSVQLTVNDVTKPSAICQGVTIYLDEDGDASTSAGAVDDGSDDACGINSLVLSKTQFDCDDIGPNSVTLTVTDNNNNTNSCNATVTVVDNIPPQIICPDNKVICADPVTNKWVGVGLEPEITENCDYTLTYALSGATNQSGPGDANGKNFNVGLTTVTYTVDDGSNPPVQCSFTVRVRKSPRPDWIQPVIMLCNGASFNIASYVKDLNKAASRYEFYHGNPALPGAVFLGASTATNGNVNFGQVRTVLPAGNNLTTTWHEYWVIAIKVYPDITCSTQSVNPFTVEVRPVPTLLPLVNLYPCVGDMVQVSFGASLPGSTFLWTNSNTAIGLPANGTGQISFTAAGAGQSGTISARASLNNCISAPQVFTITVDPCPPNAHQDLGGVDEITLTGLAEAGNIKVYPVPASNRLNVETGTPLDHDCRIALFDAMGKVVSTVILSKGETRVAIPVQQLAAGLYSLQLTDGQGYVFSARVLKE